MSWKFLDHEVAEKFWIKTQKGYKKLNQDAIICYPNHVSNVTKYDPPDLWKTKFPQHSIKFLANNTDTRMREYMLHESEYATTISPSSNGKRKYVCLLETIYKLIIKYSNASHKRPNSITVLEAKEQLNITVPSITQSKPHHLIVPLTLGMN